MFGILIIIQISQSFCMHVCIPIQVWMHKQSHDTVCLFISDTSVSDALAPCQYKKAFHEHPKEEIDDDYHRDTKVFFDDTVHAYSSPKPGGALDEDDDSGILGQMGKREGGDCPKKQLIIMAPF